MSVAASSRRVAKTPPPIIDILLEKYPDVRFNLAPGAPSAKPNPHALADCQQRLSDKSSVSQFSHYDEVVGSKLLRLRWLEYIVGRKSKSNSPDALLPEHEIMITAGANQAFVNVIVTICDPGDEVIVIAPYYFSHVNALLMLDVSPVYVQVDERSFFPSVPEIERAITPRTRAVVLTNPGNPSGVVIPRGPLDQLSDVCRRNKVFLCIDEAYREYDLLSSADSACIAYSPQLHSNMIKLYTMSKAFGMAGWRIGAVVYPKALSLDMRKVQDTIPTHAPMFSQALAAEALKYAPTHMESVIRIRHVFVSHLIEVYKDTPLSDRFVKPTGAFYLFLPYRLESGRSKRNDDDVVDLLAEKYDVLTAPGYAFGMPGYIRVCYGALDEGDAPEAAVALSCGFRSLVNEVSGTSL